MEHPSTLSSDHIPILSELGLTVQTIADVRPRLRWNWKQADWPAYTSALDRAILEYTSRGRGGSLTEDIRFLSEAMLSAASSHIGMSRAKRVGKEWLTPEVAEAIRVGATYSVGAQRTIGRSGFRRVGESVLS